MIIFMAWYERRYSDMVRNVGMYITLRFFGHLSVYLACHLVDLSRTILCIIKDRITGSEQASIFSARHVVVC